MAATARILDAAKASGAIREIIALCNDTRVEHAYCWKSGTGDTEAVNI
jgi:hypothetical protein